MFYAKTFAKMLHNIFSRIEHDLKTDRGTCKIKHLQKCFRAVDFLWLCRGRKNVLYILHVPTL